MGLRYRKSINLGGGFRINLSKSGIGYSWGVKGYRSTKTARGGTRTTASIPGTGISWVEETGGRRKSSPTQHNNSPTNNPIDHNHYDTQNIENQISKDTISEGLEEMLATAKRAIQLNLLSNIGIIVFALLTFVNPIIILLTIVSIILKVIVKTKGIIDLDYTIEDDQKSIIKERMQPFSKMMNSNKVWRIMQTSKVIDKKYTSGASNTVKRTPCKVNSSTIFPYKANVDIISLIGGGETLLFLPDKVFITKGSNIGILSYSDFSIKNSTTRFIESEKVPSDAAIVGQTWQYANKSGGPDKRFKNNRQLPICLYGEIALQSDKGLNTVVMHSKTD